MFRLKQMTCKFWPIFLQKNMKIVLLIRPFQNTANLKNKVSKNHFKNNHKKNGILQSLLFMAYAQ